MTKIDPARLRLLLDYTGLSIADAADLCGIGAEAMSRKLAGKDRYDVRQSEIDALGHLADFQDRSVETALAVFERERPKGDHVDAQIEILIYRKNEDLHPTDIYPYAAVTRMIAARISRQVPVFLQYFDRARYDDWRGAAPDTREARQAWLNETRYRIGLKLGKYTYNDHGHTVLSHAAIGLKPGTVVKQGREKIWELYR